MQYLSRRAATGQQTPVAVAKKRPLKARELAASGGVYTALDRLWLLPNALIPAGYSPKPADVLTDSAGTRWTVLEAENTRNGSTWRLTCRDLVLALDLRDKIDVERAALSQDAAGAVVKLFPSGPAPNGGKLLFAAVPARVQLLTDEIKDERGIRGFSGTHAIIVGQELTGVTNEDRVALTVAGKTTYYDIVGYHNATRIDELPILDVESRP